MSQLLINHIVLPWATYTEPRPREVDLEHSLKKGSDKVNMMKEGRNTQKKSSHIVQPGLRSQSPSQLLMIVSKLLS